jgi:hypothetical protein
MLRSGKPFHPVCGRQSLFVQEGLQPGLIGGPAVKIVAGVDSTGDEDRFNAVVERPADIGMGTVADGEDAGRIHFAADGPRARQGFR